MSLAQLLHIKGIGIATITKLRKQFSSLHDLVLHVPRKFITVTTSLTQDKTIAIRCTPLQVKHYPKCTLVVTDSCKLMFFSKITIKLHQPIVVVGVCKDNTIAHPQLWPIATTIIPIYNVSGFTDYKFHMIALEAASLVGTDITITYDNISTTLSNLLIQAHKSNHTHLLAGLEKLAIDSILSRRRMNVEPIMITGRQLQMTHRLTADQQQAIQDILHDLQSTVKSHRMIFGDVGTGKTLVAILAAWHVYNAGKCILYLAPTRLLAKQAFIAFTKYIDDVQLLSSDEQRTNVQSNARVIIGTHTLLYRDFDNIGLVIIDEEHKFGVQQRNTLLSYPCHSLSLTATPIPRSLMQVLSMYAHVSTLTEKPKPTSIKTLVVHDTTALIAKLTPNTSSLIYWICPAIDCDEFTNAVSKYEELSGKFKCGLLHGRLTAEQQERVYQQALMQEIQILVTTTVIEVGVDIPHADMIIVEQADRFGLAQLHQLRGRVGRNGKPGVCILVGQTLTRLRQVQQCDNGFDLAQLDLSNRGFGELFGLTQSGFKHFRFIDALDSAVPNVQCDNLQRLCEVFDVQFIHEGKHQSSTE